MKNNKTEPIPVMDYRQYRRARKLVHECCNYIAGNCIALDDARHFREAVKLPLVYVGGLVSRTKIDEVLDAGFDCVAMARALINEPDFVNRMKNEGEERCACTHANYCIARMYSIEMACHKHLHDLPCPVRREVERLDREAWQ